MNKSTSIEFVLNLWEQYFSGLDFPDVPYINAWRVKFSEEEIRYAFDVAVTALEKGRVSQRDTERIGRYISATLKKQRQQHEEVQSAIERRTARIEEKSIQGGTW